MTPSVSNATGSEREEGSAWREGLGILGDRCDLVIKREDDFFYLINTSSDLLAISGDRCLIQPCHQEVDQFDDHNKCDDLIKNQNTFTTMSTKVKCGRLSCGLVREERQILSSATNAVLSSSYRWGGG